MTSAKWNTQIELPADPSTALEAATKQYVDNGLATKAASNNATLTGVPTAPTAAVNTNTTQLATTAFVLAQISALNSFGHDMTLAGDLLPDADNVRSLGSPELMWKDVYIGPGSLYLNGQKVLEDTESGTIRMTADSNQNIAIQTQGTGDVELNPLGTGVIQLKGNVLIDGAAILRSSDGLSILFDDSIEFLPGAGIVGGLNVDGNAVWHGGNFTPSSKLDASVYTAADVLTKIKTVDGAGSGLDADLLGGFGSASYLRKDAGGQTVGTGVSNQDIILTIANPGIGYANGFTFSRTSDGAGMHVTEYSNDSTLYEMWMYDNPDTANDIFSWRYMDWQGLGGAYQPLQIANKQTRFIGTDARFYAPITQSTGPFFTTADPAQTNNTKYINYINDYAKLKLSGPGTVTITNLNLTGYTGTNGAVMWIVLTAANTFDWGYGRCDALRSPVQTGLAVSTSPVTLLNGMTVTFSSTTTGAANDTFQWRNYRKPTTTLSDTTITGTVDVSQGANLQSTLAVAGDATFSGGIVINKYSGGLKYNAFNAGVFYAHGTSGAGDNVYTLTRNGSSNYDWNQYGKIYSNGSEVWHTGNFTPSSKLDASANAVSATKLATARSFSLTGVITATGVNFDGTGNVALSTVIADGVLSIAKTSGLQTALDSKANASDVTTALGLKLDASLVGAANGVTPLGADSKIPAIYLPSYVDDVIEVANYAALPGTGESSKIYVTLDTNQIYRWTGSGYVEISSAGTADTATRWSVARLLTLSGKVSGSASIDGSADVVLNVTGLSGVKADVGLGNVDNTSDANKPVSTATQTALNDKVSISATNLGKTGNVAIDAVTNTPALWAALPVGYARMMSSSIGTAGGAPAAANGYFFKVANRDVSGGWAGIWLPHSGVDAYIGNAADSTVNATWRKLWNDANDGAGSGLDADLLDGNQGSFYQNADNINAGTISANRLPTTVMRNSYLGLDTVTAVPLTGFWDDGAGPQLKYTSNTTGSTGFPTELGATWSFRPQAAANASNYNRTFDLYRVYNGNDFYLRGYDGVGAALAWAKIWTSASDGAGSGLDADLLDGQEGSYYRNASNINAGTIAKVYLPALDKNDVGLGNVDNTSDANKPVSTATQTALNLKLNATAKAVGLTIPDTRAVVTTPETLTSPGLVLDFKSNATDGLVDGGNYFAELSLRPFGSTTDWSGGPAHQMGFTANGNLWHRSGTGTTWGAWAKFWDNVSLANPATTDTTQTITGIKSFQNHVNATAISGKNPMLRGFVLDIHPESPAPVLLPMITNDLAYLTSRGGTCTTNHPDLPNGSTNWFDGSASYGTFTKATIPAEGMIITVNFPNALNWSSKLGIHFGHETWAPSDIKLEVFSVTANNWVTVNDTTGWDRAAFYVTYGSDGSGINAMRWTLKNWAGTSPRIADISAVNYQSDLLKKVFVGRDGGDLYGTLKFTTLSANSFVKLDGSKNVIERTAAQMVSDLGLLAATDTSRLVGTTASGAAGAQDGANTWAKLASFDCPTQFTDATYLYALMNKDSATQVSALFNVYVRANTTGTAPSLGVEIISIQGAAALADDSFKLIANNNNTGYELWVKKTTTYLTFALYELAKHKSPSSSVTYFTNSAWTATVPVGSVANATSSGLRYREQSIWHAGNFTPANKLDASAYTAADVLAKLLTVDGAASGIDADLLDGQQGAYYLNAANLNAGTLLAARLPAFTGDVTTVAGAVATTIAAGAVTLSKMANFAANSIMGNNTGSAATPMALTGAQVKTLLALVKADVGLSNVDNTSDANKPVSTAQQTALNLKANANDAALTGTPTAPTAAPGTDTTQIATTAFVQAAVAGAEGGITWLVVNAADVATLLTESGYIFTTGGTLRQGTLPASAPVGFTVTVKAVGGSVRIVTNGNGILGLPGGNDLLLADGECVTLVAYAVGQLTVTAGITA